MEQITAEQQIANLIHALEEQVNGPEYKGKIQDTRLMVRSLREEFERFVKGELQPTPVKDDPLVGQSED